MRSLVIAPFDAAGHRVFDTIRRALADLGIEVLRVQEISPGASLVTRIIDAIRTSDFLVVDITRQNPNVLYELGFAHALRKPTILTVSSEGTGPLPSDLTGFEYIVYDPSDLRRLSDYVQRAARSFAAMQREQP